MTALDAERLAQGMQETVCCQLSKKLAFILVSKNSCDLLTPDNFHQANL